MSSWCAKTTAFILSALLNLFIESSLKAPHSGYFFCHSFFGPANAGLKAIVPIIFSGYLYCKIRDDHPPAEYPDNIILSNPRFFNF